MKTWLSVCLTLCTACAANVAAQDTSITNDAIDLTAEELREALGVQERDIFVLPQEIDPDFNTRIGDRLRQPDSGSAAQQPSLQCRFTCSAVFPGQPQLELLWEEPAATQTQQSQLRLDVTGTSTGFVRENFGTVPLSRIPTIAANTVQAPIAAPNEPQINAASLTTQPQVLLQLVRAGQVVQRNPALPIFPSNLILQRSLAASVLPDDVVTEIQADLLTGSLPQLRMTGTFVELVGNANLRHVQMQGLQPATTYRFRLVMEEGDDIEAANEQVCRVPVCPADYEQ